MKLKNETLNKNIIWNALIILIAACLLIAAVEGIGFRHKLYYSEKLYYLEIVNLTKLNLINSQFNHSAISATSFNSLFHDVYGLLVAEICIAFISTCLPLAYLLFERSEENKKPKILLASRLIGFIGVALILAAAILYVTKYTALVNLGYTVGNQINYKTAEQLFDISAYAGLLIMIVASGSILVLTPQNLK